MTIPRWRIVAAFAAVYFIWGSSYLAIQIAIETLPPLISASVRFIVAGSILLIWALLRGLPRPTGAQWRAGSISGALLFLVASGGVTWATQYLPSSLIALANATIPLWMVLIDWLIYHSLRPGLVLFTGLLLGVIGMALLLEPEQLVAGTGLYPPAVLVLLMTPVAWAWGSMLSRRRLSDVPASVTISMQLLSGGVLLLLFGLLRGEVLQLDTMSIRSLGALVYLTIGSSIIAFSSYIWLLRVDSPVRASTYAFVNPVVALVLGVALANEPFTLRTLLAAIIILAGVIVITYHWQLDARVRPRLMSLFNHPLR